MALVELYEKAGLLDDVHWKCGSICGAVISARPATVMAPCQVQLTRVCNRDVPPQLYAAISPFVIHMFAYHLSLASVPVYAACAVFMNCKWPRHRLETLTVPFVQSTQDGYELRG